MMGFGGGGSGLPVQENQRILESVPVQGRLSMNSPRRCEARGRHCRPTLACVAIRCLLESLEGNTFAACHVAMGQTQIG